MRELRCDKLPRVEVRHEKRKGRDSDLPQFSFVPRVYVLQFYYKVTTTRSKRKDDRQASSPTHIFDEVIYRDCCRTTASHIPRSTPSPTSGPTPRRQGIGPIVLLFTLTHISTQDDDDDKEAFQ
jgi:hypothetical protein